MVRESPEQVERFRVTIVEPIMAIVELTCRLNDQGAPTTCRCS